MADQVVGDFILSPPAISSPLRPRLSPLSSPYPPILIGLPASGARSSFPLVPPSPPPPPLLRLRGVQQSAQRPPPTPPEGAAAAAAATNAHEQAGLKTVTSRGAALSRALSRLPSRQQSEVGSIGESVRSKAMGGLSGVAGMTGLGSGGGPGSVGSASQAAPPPNVGGGGYAVSMAESAWPEELLQVGEEERGSFYQPPPTTSNHLHPPAPTSNHHVPPAPG